MLPWISLQVVGACWGALLLSGCSMGLGASVEANAGFVGATVTDSDGIETAELATTAGLSFNVEFDFVRDASLATGFGYQTLRAPSSDDGVGDGVSAVPWTVWYGGSIENLGWTVRPRAFFGFSMARGEADQYYDVYMAAGASYYFARGTALTIVAGPHAVRASDQVLAGETTYQGWGGQVRVRLFRMLFRKCDPADRADAARMAVDDDNPC